MAVEEIPQIEKYHCFNCRADKAVIVRPVGPVNFHKCVDCGLWIRCPKCMHIRAVEDHRCPEQEASV